MTRVWQPLPEERSRLYSPVGLRLVDEISGRPPIGWVRPRLDLEIPGGWRRLDEKAVVTASRVVTYPGLGRRAEPAGAAPRRYRVRIEARYYRPLYLATVDGVAFDAPAYNDTNPPSTITSFAQDTFLLPSTSYPFPAHVPVLHGQVEDASGQPVANILVREGLREQVLTDERGAFSLPLRWGVAAVPTPIDAEDQRTSRSGTINVTLPGALNQSHTITIA